jgi:hypothetical protein
MFRNQQSTRGQCPKKINPGSTYWWLLHVHDKYQTQLAHSTLVREQPAIARRCDEVGGILDFYNAHFSNVPLECRMQQ